MTDPQVRRRLDVLALVAVEEEAVKHVDDVDEELGAPHSLDEVEWAAHLRHELREQHSSAVRVDGLHETVDSGAEI